MDDLLEALNDSYQEADFLDETPKTKMPQTDPKQRSRRNFNSMSILDNKLENRLLEDPLNTGEFKPDQSFITKEVYSTVKKEKPPSFMQ